MSETTTTAKLGAALAEFQAKVGAVPRSKEVTVQTKSGGSYKFKYAPHEAIIEAIRVPLGEAGLSVSQHLSSLPDGIPALRTVLLHSSGERIEDTFPLPTNERMTAQELGSAVTYIRRYALSAILGLATDDDDDGNHASGNTAKFAQTGRSAAPKALTREPESHAAPPQSDAGLIGIVEQGDKSTSDFEIRYDPDGVPHLGFRLKGDKGGILVEAAGELAEDLMVSRTQLVGSRVTCWGRIGDRSFTGKDGRRITYQALALERLAHEGSIYPVVRDAPSIPLFADDEAELDALLA